MQGSRILSDVKRGQDLKGNPSLMAGRPVAPRFAEGKKCAWCDTPVFASQTPKPLGRGKWSHGSGCLSDPKSFELERLAARRLRRRGVDGTRDERSSELESMRLERDAQLLVYLAHSMRPGVGDREWDQLNRSLPDRAPTPLILQAMDIAGDTDTTRWLRTEMYYDHFNPWDEDDLEYE